MSYLLGFPLFPWEWFQSAADTTSDFAQGFAILVVGIILVLVGGLMMWRKGAVPFPYNIFVAGPMMITGILLVLGILGV